MKISKNDWMAIAGFSLFMLGFLALILSSVGIHFSFLAFLEIWGRLAAFLLKLLMVITGFVLIYFSKT